MTGRMSICVRMKIARQFYEKIKKLLTNLPFTPIMYNQSGVKEYKGREQV
jgi:hypothetical protein